MAVPNVDFTALVQKFTGPAPVNGAPGIVINPGEVTVTGLIGNPVLHPLVNQIATNVTVFINLTNNCAGSCNTNLLDGGGFPYIVTTPGITFNLFDNALGGETVLWSNPLTNSFDSTNWAVVVASTALSLTNGGQYFNSPTPPLIITNYDNSKTNM